MSDPSDLPRPFRAPDEPLGFVDELKKQGAWPLRPPERDHDAATATPYLVIPFHPSDVGDRPLPAPVLRSQGVQVLDPAGIPPVWFRVGETYTLHATVWNLGATASYAGITDFYLLPETAANTAQTIATYGLASGPRSQGRTGFSVRSGESVVVSSPNTFTPANKLESEFKVVVHAFDLLLDPLGVPFDWVGNRHVARW
jgi:hypothetical protein